MCGQLLGLVDGFFRVCNIVEHSVGVLQHDEIGHVVGSDKRVGTDGGCADQGGFGSHGLGIADVQVGIAQHIVNHGCRGWQTVCFEVVGQGFLGGDIYCHVSGNGLHKLFFLPEGESLVADIVVGIPAHETDYGVRSFESILFYNARVGCVNGRRQVAILEDACHAAVLIAIVELKWLRGDHFGTNGDHKLISDGNNLGIGEDDRFFV